MIHALKKAIIEEKSPSNGIEKLKQAHGKGIRVVNEPIPVP